MEWEQKVKLAEALNTGNNKEACQIILNNEMDMQAWDMFLTGMDLRQYEDYRPFIKSYPNAQIASKETHIPQSNINRCVNNKLKSAGGYLWKKI